MITRIRIPSEWRDDNGKQHIRIADFTLGLGSCGKVVTGLRYHMNDMGNMMTITQVTEDGEHKHFSYPGHLLTGRIEITQQI